MNEQPIASGVPEKTYAQFAWALAMRIGRDDIIALHRRSPHAWRKCAMSALRGSRGNLMIHLNLLYANTVFIGRQGGQISLAEHIREALIKPMEWAISPRTCVWWDSSAKLKRLTIGEVGANEQLDFHKLLNYFFAIGRKIGEGQQQFVLDLPDGSRMRFYFLEEEVVEPADEVAGISEVRYTRYVPQKTEWVEPRAALTQELGQMFKFDSAWPQFRPAWKGARPFKRVEE